MFVADKAKQSLNPTRPPLVRGGGLALPSLRDGGNYPFFPLKRRDDVSLDPEQTGKRAADSPPLTREGREGLGFLPYDPKLTALARANRKNPTPAEKKIWFEVLRQRQLSAFKFLRQKPIDRFIVDLYCSSLRWVIEVDGDSHSEDPVYDFERTDILQGYGLTVIRYFNNEVMRNIGGVYDDLVRRIP